MKRVLAVLLFLAAAVIPAPAPAAAQDLCSGGDATLECVRKNFSRMYQTKENDFWYILITTAKKAFQCEKPADAAELLGLVDLDTDDGEFGKFYSAQIENLCASKPRCFLDALETLAPEVRASVMKRLSAPQFVEKAVIDDALGKAREAMKKGPGRP